MNSFGTLARFVKTNNNNNNNNGDLRLQQEQHEVDRIPVKGCMTKFSEQDVKELGEREFGRLPVLAAAQPGEQPMVKFSALLPKEDVYAYPLVRGNLDQSELRVKVETERDGEQEQLNSHALCKALGSCSQTSKAELLPMGFSAHCESEDEDSEMDGTIQVIDIENSSSSSSRKKNKIDIDNEDDDDDDDDDDNEDNEEDDEEEEEDEADSDDEEDENKTKSKSNSKGRGANDDANVVVVVVAGKRHNEQKDDQLVIKKKKQKTKNLNGISDEDDDDDENDDDDDNDTEMKGYNHDFILFPYKDCAWEKSINWGDEGGDEEQTAEDSDGTTTTTANSPQNTNTATIAPLKLVLKRGSSVIARAEGKASVKKGTATTTTTTTTATATTSQATSQNKDDSDDSDDEDSEDDIAWDTSTAPSANAARSSNSPATVLNNEDDDEKISRDCTNAWQRHNNNSLGKAQSKVIDNLDLNEIVLHDKLETPINEELASYNWLNQIVWDNNLAKEKVLVDDSDDAPLILDRNDTANILREEVENAYGSDIRPGSLRTTQAQLVSKKKEVVDAREMKTKQLKKYTKEGRKKKLRSNGYFRFIDAINSRNIEQGKGTQSRLKAKRLPDIPKEIVASDYKSQLSKTEARLIHRPRHALPRSLKFSRPEKPKGGGVRQFRMKWNESDLSAMSTAGSVCLFEYLEERPPLLCNVGMSSLLVNFYQSDKPTDETFTPPPCPNGAVGRTVVLEPGDRSPFFSIMKPRHWYTAMCNDLWVAPVFEHKVSRNDFLLVRKHSQNSNQFFIRNINSLHIIGQTEPQREVFHPTFAESRANKKGPKTFVDNFLEYHIFRRIFEKQKFNLDVNYDLNIFNDQIIPRSVVTKAFQQLKQNVSNQRVTRDVIDAHRDQIPAPTICQFESLQAGLQRLEDLNIHMTAKCDVTRVLHAQAILRDIYQFKEKAAIALQEAVQSGGSVGVVQNSPQEKELNKRLRGFVKLAPDASKEMQTAQFVVDELQLSPWYLTTSYVTQRSMEKPKLEITGIGDPSGRREAVSYLPDIGEGLGKKNTRRRRGRMTQGSAATAAAVSAVQAATADEKNKNAQKKPGVDKFGGTDWDLRHLSLDDGKDRLLRLQHTPQEIELLDRWDRIMLVEEYASAAGGAENIPFLAKFARNVQKMSEKEIKERDKNQKKINHYFHVQQDILARTEPPETEEQRIEKLKQQKKQQKEKRDLRKKKEKEKKMKAKAKAKRAKAKAKKKQKEGKNADDDDDDDDESESDSDSSDSDSDSDSGIELSDDDDDDDDDDEEDSSSSDDDDDSSSSSEEEEGGDAADSFLAALTMKQPSNDNMMESSGSASAGKKKSNQNEPVNQEQKHLEEWEQRNKRAPSEAERKKLQEQIELAKVKAKEYNIPNPPGWTKGKRQILKRTIIKKRADGSTEVYVEYVKSLEAIRRSRERPRANHTMGLNRNQRVLVDRSKKGTDKLRENGLKLYQWYLKEKQKHGSGWPMSIPTKKDEKRCTACHMPGHTSNNRTRCPLFWVDDDQRPPKEFHPKPAATSKVFTGRGRGGALGMLKKRGNRKRANAAAAATNSVKNQGQGPLCDLSLELVKIWQKLYSKDESSLFRQKVDKKVYPEYYRVIKKHMYLDKIKQKIEELKYSSSDQFLDDMQQILKNSIMFNGPAALITENARKLLSITNTELDRNRDTFRRLNQGIATQGKKRKTTKSAASSAVHSSSSSSSSSSTTSTNTKKRSPSGTLVHQTSMTMDPFQLTGAAGASATPGNDFYSVESSPFPMASPSPSPGVQPSPSPPPATPFTPFPAPSPPATSPPANSAEAELMDMDLEQLAVEGEVVEEVEEEIEEEEILD